MKRIKMGKEIDIDIEGAFRQAPMTAHDYLNHALITLKEFNIEYTTADAIKLAHIMAIDFNGTMQNVKLQELRDAIKEISIVLEPMD